MSFIDEYSHYSTIYFLKSKSSVFEHFKKFVAMSEKETGCKLKCIRSDNGGEYATHAWDAWCDERGIKHSMGPPYSPQLNGIAERFNRTLLDRVLPSLFQSKLPVKFWSDAARHAIRAINLSPSRTLPKDSCPKMLWRRGKVSYSHLKSFGCKAWRMLTGPQRSNKLSEKARPCLHLYSLPDGDGWMLWDITSQRTVKSRDVIFHEDSFPGLGAIGKKTEREWEEWECVVKRQLSPLDSRSLSPPANSLTPVEHTESTDHTPPVIVTITPDPTPPSTPPLEFTLQDRFDRRLEASIHNRLDTPREDETEDQVPDDDVPSEQEEVDEPRAPVEDPLPPSPTPTGPRRGARTRKPVNRYGFTAQALLVRSELTTGVSLSTMKAMVASTDPKTFREATRGHDRESWLAAMNSEMESLLLNKVFDLVPLPIGKRAIGCRWHYRTKAGEDGKPGRKKARLVAKGYLQRKGIDYQETYAPSTRHETIRLVMSKMAVEAWDSCQMDVMTAFLNSFLREEVYMKQPDGFVDAQHPDWVWRIRASLYGLKQSPREWNHLLTKELKSLGMTQSPHDPVLFTQKSGNEVVAAVVVHVDDIYLTGKKAHLDRIRHALSKRFKMSKSGDLDTYISLKVERNSRGEVFLSQKHYIHQIAEKHLSSPTREAHVPCKSTFSDLTRDAESALTSKPYAELVGMLQWVANGTRPDIQFAVNRLSQFLTRPTDLHWEAAEHVLRYLYTTRSLRLGLGTASQQKLHGFSDSDWASTSEDRRSTTGWVYRYAGGVISWKSRRQPTVALSSTEGEYMAMTDAAKEAIWLKGLSQDLGIDEGVTRLFYDNQGAGCLSTGEGLMQRTKHIDVKHHFIRDCIASKKIDVSHVPTADMLADVFTKPLGRVKHSQALEALGLV